MTFSRVPASFRDRTGAVYETEEGIYRGIHPSYREHYDLLHTSGLYAELTHAGLLIPHHETSLTIPDTQFDLVIQPERVEYISYPYEWSFSQLQDAAITTLEIQRRALERGLTLKDASAYNIQFHRGRPLLIDTLSLERYEEGSPWVGYRQFCQHFLAPLALMSQADARLGQLLRIYIDGVPLDLAARLLPGRTRLRLGLLLHLYLHARGQRRYADRPSAARAAKMSRSRLQALVSSLASTVRRLTWKPEGTEWGEYYQFTNYEGRALHTKRELVSSFLDRTKPRSVWDLGANTGVFSRISSDRGIPTVAYDIDPAAVEKNYREVRSRGETALLPLVMDLTNPSPALGWALTERASLLDRGPTDLILFLAMIHHLAIGNNVPLTEVARFLHGLTRHLAIEFIPKTDSQVRRMLQTRRDVFPDYHEQGFQAAFGDYFKIRESQEVTGSERTLYLMEAR